MSYATILAADLIESGDVKSRGMACATWLLANRAAAAPSRGLESTMIILIIIVVLKSIRDCQCNYCRDRGTFTVQ